MKQFLKQAFEGITGARIYRRSLPRGTCLFRDLSLLTREPPTEIWDVGAHMGETAIRFRRTFPTATLRSFEPIGKNYEELSAVSATLGAHHAHHIALGAKRERLCMRIRRASVLNSLTPDLNKPEQDDLGEEEVEVETVDHFRKDNEVEQIHLLKLDVEGYETQVLAGAQDSLQAGEIDFIYLEIGMDDRFNSLNSLVEQLAPYAMYPYAFYEQTAHWSGNQRLWYWNALFAKNELLQ
mgnify:CR=1 FL=1